MKKRILSFLLAVITVFYVCPTALFSAAVAEETQVEESTPEKVTHEGYIEGKVSLSCDTAQGGTVYLKKGEKTEVYTELSEEIDRGAKYIWQLKLSDNRWANVQDYVLPHAPVSDALIANATLEDGFAALRCVVSCGDKQYVSGEMRIAPSDMTESFSSAQAQKADQPISAVSMSNKTGETMSLASSSDAFQIVINYRYRHATVAPLLNIDGVTAANTFTVSLPQGGYYTGTVATPTEIGYLPYVKLEQKDYVTKDDYSVEPITYDGEQYILAHSIEFENQTMPETVNVYYIPQLVELSVNFFEQNIYNDEYSLVETKKFTRIANEAIGEGYDVERHGFTSIGYDVDEPIAEDGSYVLDVYYERHYYLVDYEADAEAQGTTPHFIRYNTQAMMPAPTLLGHTFITWTLISVKDKDGNTVAEHPYAIEEAAGTVITVQHNLVYKASWELSTAYYTVVFWLENAESANSADKENYDVWYTHKIQSKTGNQTIVGSDCVKQYVTLENGFTQDQESDVLATYPYLSYNEALTDTETKTLLGNGTTTINVYYARKSYTLKFYYAIEKTSQSSSTYHLIGGSTYYFGGNATGTAQTDEIAAMRQYASGSYTTQTGQVTALPTLNSKGQARPYTVSSDQDGNNRYHFISFSAKFGADISQLWPCDVFNSAERSSANTHGNWSGKQAFVSAWNGEYRVRYTQDSSVNNGNQTIKGNYTHLDQNLLWNSTSVTETTVSYACFWENGANIGWSVPELYRYNIYLPTLPGQDTTGLTLRTYNGTTYYLSSQYDTCDDSSTSAQTQPGLVGFKSNGRDWARITSFDTSVYKEAYDMFFYYSRNIYHITFNDQHGNSVTTTVPYDTYLGDHSEDAHTPAYPADLELGESVFAGWYQDEGCQIAWGHDIRMPAKNIQLYAKWETLTYNVRVYYDYFGEENTSDAYLALNETVPFGMFVKEPEYRNWLVDNSSYESLIFAGWYYMDGTVEKRIDFNTMMIKKDMVIYAKWTSKVLVAYTVRYVTEKDGVLVDVATPRTGNARVGTTKTFYALVGNNLDALYRAGYYPEMRSHSMTMKNTGANEYNFVYTYASEITYTVTHVFRSNDLANLLKDNATTLTETFTHTITAENAAASAASVGVSFREGITKEALAKAAAEQRGTELSETEKETLWQIITGMRPDAFEQDVILSTTQENDATFNWVKNEGVGTYQIVHYEQTLTGEYVVYQTVKNTANIGTEIQATYMLPQQSGFYVDEALTQDKGVVKGLSVNSDGTLSEGLVLRVYYARNRYNYTVHHYESGTVNSLAPSTTGSALHGTEIAVSDVYTEVEGYAVANQSRVYGILEDNTEVICYYSGLDVYYRYQIVGSAGATLNTYTSDTVVGAKPNAATLSLTRGYYVEGWYYTVGSGEAAPLPAEWLTNNGMTVSPTETPVEWAGETVYIYAIVLPKTRTFSVSGAVSADQAFAFELKGSNGVDVTFIIFGNGSVNIAMLPYDTYTVTVLNWAWRYGAPTASHNGESFTAENGVFTLTLEEEGEVTFTYSEEPEDRWLSHDIASTVTPSLP